MITIADKLKEFGFKDSSFQNNNNGSRISAYRERPLHEGLYSGWKTFSSAPIVREVSWNEILRKNQKIKISYVFKRRIQARSATLINRRKEAEDV